MPGTVIEAFYVQLPVSILTTPLQGKCYYYVHISDEKKKNLCKSKDLNQNCSLC